MNRNLTRIYDLMFEPMSKESDRLSGSMQGYENIDSAVPDGQQVSYTSYHSRYLVLCLLESFA